MFREASINLKNVIETIKDTVRKISAAESPIDKLFIIIEAATRLFENTDQHVSVN